MTRLRPETDREVADIVRWAVADDASLEVVGGGTKRGFGRPVEAAHTLDLSALRGIVAYEPSELFVTAGAGTPVAEIEAALAEHRQRLAFEPRDLRPVLASEGAPTAGGMVGANLAGPRRFAAGAVRDHVLGIAAVSGRGEPFKGGGQVVKNVTGYDMPKLMTGSLGTLAVLTGVTLRVVPAARESTLLLFGQTAPEAAQLLLEMAPRGGLTGGAHLSAALCRRSGLARIAARGTPVTALRFEGEAAPVLCNDVAAAHAAAAPQVLDEDEAAALWREVRDLAPFAPAPEPLWRVAIAASKAACVLDRLGLGEESAFTIDGCGGLIWFAASGTASEFRAAVGGDGQVTLVRAPEDARRTQSVFQPQPPALAALTARIKAQFDPNSVLNPGRMYAGV